MLLVVYSLIKGMEFKLYKLLNKAETRYKVLHEMKLII